MIVTVRFDDLDSGRPVALTIAVLRPDMFRVVVQPDAAAAAAGRKCGQFVRFLDARRRGLGTLTRYAHHHGRGGRAATAALAPAMTRLAASAAAS